MEVIDKIKQAEAEANGILAIAKEKAESIIMAAKDKAEEDYKKQEDLLPELCKNAVKEAKNLTNEQVAKMLKQSQFEVDSMETNGIRKGEEVINYIVKRLK